MRTMFTAHLADPRPADLRMAQVFDPHAAKCTCGWVGPLRPTREQAERDARLHEGGDE